MANPAERELPSGIVRFTITREELKNILGVSYSVGVESVSVEEDGIEISLKNPERKET